MSAARAKRISRVNPDRTYSPPGEWAGVEIRWPWLAQYRDAWVAYRFGDRDPQVVAWAQRFEGWYETQYEWLHNIGPRFEEVEA